VVDTNDDDAVWSLVTRSHAERRINAVVPGSEHYVPLAARLAAALGLPGLDPAVALRVRNKHRMRLAVAAAGIDQPRWCVVGDEADLPGAITQVGLPCVVKPVDLSGSLHVRKAETVEEAFLAFRDLSGAADPDLGRSALPLALVEEFVAGREVSVEGYVENGRVRVCNLTDKLLGAEPCFVEVGHVVPADLPATDVSGVTDYVTRVAAALGLSLGPFHAEVRLAAHGPLLMEVAARLGGDRIPHLVSIARGVDLHDIALRCHLGLPVRATAEGTGGTAVAGIRYFLRPGLERYREVEVDERLRDDGRVSELTVLVPPDADIPSPTSSRGRLGYTVVRAGSHAEVRALLDVVDRCTPFR
jgi:biotin carboxylase